MPVPGPRRAGLAAPPVKLVEGEKMWTILKIQEPHE